MDPHTGYLIIALLIALVYPANSILFGKQTKLKLIAEPRHKKMLYIQTWGIQLLLCLMILCAFLYYGNTLTTIGLQFFHSPMIISILMIVVAVFTYLMSQLKIPEAKVESLKASYDEMKYFLPTNTQEYKWAILLSIMVGFGEEIIFRAFLFEYANLYMPAYIAVMAVNLIFGLCHFGSGIKNMAGAFLLGVVFSALYLFLGTLWPSILLHILIDIYASSLTYKLYDERE